MLQWMVPQTLATIMGLSGLERRGGRCEVGRRCERDLGEVRGRGVEHGYNKNMSEILKEYVHKIKIKRNIKNPAASKNFSLLS